MRQLRVEAQQPDGAMRIYRHRQVGTLTVWALGITLVWIGAVLVLLGFTGAASTPAVALCSVVLVVLAVAMLLFGSLTVEVSRERIRLWFGPGLIHRTFRVGEIRHAAAVRNHWYYGWGIRLIPHGWMFNVSGLDAVELELESGRRFRIGTDEPLALLAAIRAVITESTCG